MTPLGRLEAERLVLVQADFNARVSRIVQKELKASTPATVHRELSEAMQTILNRAPRTERKIQILEAIRELNKELAKCDEGA